MKVRQLSIFIFIVLILSSFCFQQVQAASLGGSLDSLAQGMSGGISILFGDVHMQGGSPGEILFIKLLVFILLFAVIDMILRRVPMFAGNRGIALLVSIIVSLISVRFMTTESVINFIWLPYGVLGIVFTVLLPFIIGFFFIESFDSDVIRRVGWITYVVVFAGLAITRWDSMSTGGPWYNNLAWMYLAIAILSGLLLLFDKSLRSAMYLSSMRGVQDVNKRVKAAEVSAEIEKNRRTLAMTTDPKARAALEQQIREQKNTIKALMRS